MLLGVHCSIAGGLENAFVEAKELGINTFQIFTKNQRQWKEKEIDPKEGKSFQRTQSDSNVQVAFSHSMYLINLASGNPELLEKLLNGITGELKRCEALGLAFTVLHPGSAKDRGEEESIKTIAEQLKKALKATEGDKAKVLLENTAGQGATIGRNFDQLKQIYDLVESDRIGFCFDTCHAFSAGFDIRTKDGIEDTLGKWDKIISLKNLNCLHLNDSKGKLGSNLDRHEHIGHGEIGETAFAYIMQNFPDIPKVIETPKDDDWDEKNLAKLRSLAN